MEWRFKFHIGFTIYALSWPGVSIAAGEPMVLSLCRGLAGGQGPDGQTLCLPALVVQRRVLQRFQDCLLAIVRGGQSGQRHARACLDLAAGINVDEMHGRSEERRVGKECRSRWSPYH